MESDDIRCTDLLGRVLVACEHSGVVRDAFARQGWDAWSCDVKPADNGGQHYQCDVREILDDGWDMMIAHPPCTYLCSSGLHWTTRGLRDPKLTDEAIAFAELLWDAPIKRVCLENPVGCLSTRSKLGKSYQRIQPHDFGEDASKATCLWIRGMPPLRPTRRCEPRIVNGKRRWANQDDNGQNKQSSDRHNKRAIRSRTFAGVAEAMANQWTLAMRPNGKLTQPRHE